MPTSDLPPIHAFETIKTAFNRWRADHAATLTRDEAVRHVLGEWLIQQGYLPPNRPGTLPSVEPQPAAKTSTPGTYAVSTGAAALPSISFVRGGEIGGVGSDGGALG